MGQSLVQNYLHIVFQTKNTAPLILPEIEDSVYEYLGGICNQLDSPSITIGGHLDHVHILCRLSKNISLSEFIQKVKSSSSKLIKTKSPKSKNFYWQDGYGAFSISQSQVKPLTSYIKNQHNHHQKISFKAEYIDLLKKYEMDFNENYLW